MNYPPKRWINRIWEPVPLPSYTRDLKTIAYHEAGHALLFLANGISILEVYLDIESDQAGEAPGHVRQDRQRIAELREEMAHVKPPSDEAQKRRSDQEGILRAAAIFLAGEQAELILHGLTVDGPVYTSSPDQRVAMGMLRDAFRHTHGVYYCQRLARAILLDLWPVVESIANALLKTGRLDSDQVRRVIADC